MRCILVTGAAGFIGSNFVRLLSGQSPDLALVALDKLTYAGNLANLEGLIDGKKRVFVRGDIGDAELVRRLLREHSIDAIVNFAAESHVDRSILGAAPFVMTNVVGTQILLDAAREAQVQRFVQISTDEVYGSLPEDRPDVKFTESTPLAPNSPYSASKAAADGFCRAAFHTFGLPVMITRCSNNFGPWQFPEKLIPLFITNLIDGQPVPLYGDGMNVRDWIHVEDHCQAVWQVLTRGRPGEVYNIGGDSELTNRAVTEIVLKEMGRDWNQSVRHVPDRPGHDRRYAIDASKMKKELGWSPRHRFDQAIRDTIRWYADHPAWWRAIKSGEYMEYYQRQYGAR